MKKVTVFLRRFYERFISLKSKDIPVQVLMYYYSLYLIFILTSVSVITNVLIGMPIEVTAFSVVGSVLSIFLYWLARYKHKVILSQIIFLFFLFGSFNSLWILSEGSSGSTLLIIQGFLLLFIFFGSRRMLKFIIPLLFINVLVLFYLELSHREWIVPYSSANQRTLDVFVMVIVFFVLELPILAYAKRAILTERNSAIASESMKTQYFLGLSHEIRTPMNAILGFSELLEDEDLETEYRREYVAQINNNGRLLLNLINNVLSFSKLESHGNVIRTSIGDVNELINHLHQSMKPLFANSKNVDFRVVPSPVPVLVECDSIMIYQILSNIIFNAMKFTEKGYVELGYTHDSHSVTFYVTDTGIGILPEHQDTIFSRFHQSHQTLKASAQQGAGLGLAICERMVKLHHGKIWFDTKVGEGTTFYVSIPKKHKKHS
jgi:signal transduction histidine kinase